MRYKLVQNLICTGTDVSEYQDASIWTFYSLYALYFTHISKPLEIFPKIFSMIILQKQEWCWGISEIFSIIGNRRVDSDSLLGYDKIRKKPWTCFFHEFVLTPWFHAFLYFVITLFRPSIMSSQCLLPFYFLAREASTLLLFGLYPCS